MSNPFLEKFNTLFGSIPFDKIRNEHYLPALEKSILQAKENLKAIKDNTEAPSFENVILAMDNSSDAMDRVAGVFFNLNTAETNDELQAIAKEFSPKLTAYGNDVALDAWIRYEVYTLISFEIQQCKWLICYIFFFRC